MFQVRTYVKIIIITVGIITIISIASQAVVSGVPCVPVGPDTFVHTHRGHVRCVEDALARCERSATYASGVGYVRTHVARMPVVSGKYARTSRTHVADVVTRAHVRTYVRIRTYVRTYDTRAHVRTYVRIRTYVYVRAYVRMAKERTYVRTYVFLLCHACNRSVQAQGLKGCLRRSATCPPSEPRGSPWNCPAMGSHRRRGRSSSLVRSAMVRHISGLVSPPWAGKLC